MKLPENDWQSDFYNNYPKVDCLDIDLIAKLVRSLWGSTYGDSRCSIKRLSDITENPRGRFDYNSKNKSPFSGLRRIADFLGLPPWLLIDPSSNENLHNFLERFVPELDNFTMDEFEVQLRSMYDRFKHYLFLDDTMEELQWEMKQFVNKFEEIKRKSLGRNAQVQDPVDLRSLFTLVRDMRLPYSRTVTVRVANSTGWEAVATLRVCKGLLPEFKTIKPNMYARDHFWMTAWLTFEAPKSDTATSSTDISTIKILTDELFRDYHRKSTSQKKSQPSPRTEISLSLNGRRQMIYSWHSLRKTAVSNDDLAILDTHAPRSSKVLYNIGLNQSIGERFFVRDNDGEIIFTESVLTAFLKKLNLDVPPAIRSEITLSDVINNYFLPRTNLVQALINRGYLKIGDMLEIVPHAKVATTTHQTGLPTDYLGQVVRTANGPAIMLSSQQDIYFCAESPSKLMKYLGIRNSNITSVAQVWRRVGDSRSFDEVLMDEHGSMRTVTIVR